MEECNGLFHFKELDVMMLVLMHCAIQQLRMHSFDTFQKNVSMCLNADACTARAHKLEPVTTHARQSVPRVPESLRADMPSRGIQDLNMPD